jgi:hypothetical protein
MGDDFIDESHRNDNKHLANSQLVFLRLPVSRSGFRFEGLRV